MVLPYILTFIVFLVILVSFRYNKEGYAPDINTGNDQISNRQLELLKHIEDPVNNNQNEDLGLAPVDRQRLASRPKQYRQKQYDYQAYNVDNVHNQISSDLINKQNKWLSAIFKSLTDEKHLENLFDKPAGYQRVKSDRFEASKIIDYVLNLINQKTGMRFKAFDIQSFKKEIQPLKDGSVNERFTIQLFISNDLDGKVNDVAKDIAFVATKHKANIIINYLQLLGDNIHQLNLIPANNPFDKFFQLKGNPGLSEPWPTSRSKVLYPYEIEDTIRRMVDGGRKKELYACYTADGTVTNAMTHEKCKEAQGVWDSPATSNEDCPFYLANKNYNNHRGGILKNGVTVEGRCEMPEGMKRIGYKHYSRDPQEKPWCYNCKIGADGMPGTAGQCCDEQEKAIKAGYSTMITPDYMFAGDELERGNDRDSLKAKGLFWDKKANDRLHYKDTTLTAPQLQPVYNKFIGTSKENII